MRTASGIRVYKLNAYAKLNLYLDITGRRDDGYHLLETVMQSISLADEVTVVVSAGNGITPSGCPHTLLPCPVHRKRW